MYIKNKKISLFWYFHLDSAERAILLFVLTAFDVFLRNTKVKIMFVVTLDRR